MSVSATPSARAERRRLAAHPRGPRARHAHRHGQGPRRAALLSLPAVRPRLRRRALRAGPPRKRAVTLAPGQATDACLAFIGTYQVLSAVVAAAQQRLGSRRVVSATVALLAAIVRRNYSDDVSDSMAARCAPPRAPGGSATSVQCDRAPPARAPATLNAHRLLLRDLRISASAQWQAGRGWERGGGGGGAYPPTEHLLPERSAPLLFEPRRSARIRQPLSKGGKTNCKHATNWKTRACLAGTATTCSAPAASSSPSPSSLATRAPQRSSGRPTRSPPPFLPRTNRTSLVPPLVLSGHAASLTPRHAGAPAVFRPTYEVQPAPAASARPRGAEAASSVLAARLLAPEAGPLLP
jgi:hypothetical protein